MTKTKQNKIIILIMLLFFMMILPNYANAASVSVAKVKGLKATAQTSSSITVSWSKVSGANGYRIYVYNSKTKKYDYYAQPTKNSVTVKGLTSAKEYKFKVRAYKTVKGTKYFGAYSSIFSATTTPTQVKGLTTSARADTSLKISWSKVSRADGYRIYVYNSKTKKYDYYAQPTKNSVTVKGLSSANEQKFKVRAYVNFNGKKYFGSYSSVYSTTTEPTKVKGLTTSSRGDTSLKISWTKVSRADGYRIYVYNSKTKKYDYYAQPTTNSVTVKGLSTATEQKFKVRAYVNYNGSKHFGYYSDIYSTTTEPTKVKGLTTSARADTSLKISWTKVSRADGYRIYVYNSKTKKYDYYAQPTTNSVTVKGLSTASEQKFKVRAYVNYNGSKYFGYYSDVYSTTTVPKKVSGVKASPTSSSSLNLTWTKVSGANGYRVYVYNSKTKKYDYYGQPTTNSITISKDPATNKSLTYAKEYKFKVRAYKTYNNTKYFGSYSDIYAFSPVAQVTGIKATSVSSTSIKVSWNKQSSARGYLVLLYSQSSQSFEKYDSTWNSYMTISNLDPAKFYKVYVKAYAKVNGNYYYGKASSTVSQKTKSTSSTKAAIDVSEFQYSIDWDAVKKSGIDFAMIRIGFRGYGKEGNIAEDVRFEENIKGALDAGLDVGVYFFAYAKNTTEAKEEANWVIKKLKEYGISKSDCKYIAYDFESWNQNRVKGVSVSQINKNTTTFLQTVSNAGYTPVLYGNAYDLTNRFDTDTISSKFKNCKIWLAHYTDDTTYKGYDMWQYSSTGKINGISGNVDLNIIKF